MCIRDRCNTACVRKALGVLLCQSQADHPAASSEHDKRDGQMCIRDRFMDKKRSQGKPYYVYMTAGANKFLRIYYGRVKEYLSSLSK